MKSKFPCPQSKFYWNIATLLLSLIVYGYFRAMMTKMDSCERDCMAHEALNI